MTDDKTKAFWDAHVEDEFEANGHFFKASKSDGAHYLKKENGNVMARCIAVLDMPKFNDGSEHFIGEEILGEYDVQIGMTIVGDPKVANTITYNEAFTDKKTITLKAPKYDDSIASEVKKHATVFFDRFMETGDIEFDAHTPLGKSASSNKGKISMVGENVVNEDPNSPPVVRMIIKSEIPFDALPTENNFVYRHVLQLKNEDEWDADDLVFGCEVDSKDPTRHGVAQFKKDFNLQDVSKKMKIEKTDLVDSKSKICKEDPDK